MTRAGRVTGPSIPKDRYAHLLGESLLGVLEVLLLGALLLGVLLLDVPLLDVLRDAVVLLPGAEALCLPCAAFASAIAFCSSAFACFLHAAFSLPFMSSHFSCAT